MCVRGITHRAAWTLHMDVVGQTDMGSFVTERRVMGGGRQRQRPSKKFVLQTQDHEQNDATHTESLQSFKPPLERKELQNRGRDLPCSSPPKSAVTPSNQCALDRHRLFQSTSL